MTSSGRTRFTGRKRENNEYKTIVCQGMYMFTSLMSFLIVQIVQSWALGLYIYINILPGGTGT